MARENLACLGTEDQDRADVGPLVRRPIYEVKLAAFEGPLDLLLHLIREHEIDIYDIPIAEITAQYLEYLCFIESLDLALAGEFLEMAATLIRINTREPFVPPKHIGIRLGALETLQKIDAAYSACTPTQLFPQYFF